MQFDTCLLRPVLLRWFTLFMEATALWEVPNNYLLLSGVQGEFGCHRQVVVLHSDLSGHLSMYMLTIAVPYFSFNQCLS